MSLRGSGSYDEAPVRIYPADEDTESVFCRHRARLVAAVSATAVAVAVFCVATATLVWTGHIGRTTPAATDLISHYAVSDGHTLNELDSTDGCTVSNAHNIVFGSKRSAICGLSKWACPNMTSGQNNLT